MSPLLWGRTLLCVLLLNTITGCGYHLTSSQSKYLEPAQKIWVPFFANLTGSSSAQTVLRRAFYEEIYSMRGLAPAATEETADLVMKARILSYSITAVSYSAIDQVKQYSLSVAVELEISKKGQLVPIWKGQVSAVKQYPAGTNLALQRNAEEQALDAASRILAHKFLTALEESY